MSLKNSFAAMLAFALPLIALPAHSHNQLTADELEEYFTDSTQHCRKEKDQSTCTTFFSADGTIKRRMHEDGARKEGTWNIDRESDELCITWKGKDNALCFEAYMNKDNTVDMYRYGRHMSTVLTFFPGNAEGL